MTQFMHRSSYLRPACATYFVLLFLYASKRSKAADLQDTRPQATLFSGLDGNGDIFASVATNVLNITEKEWVHKALSVCVIGPWFFFENPQYNEAPGKMEFVFGKNSCVNLKHVAGKLSSVRYAGWFQDYQSSTLTLYDGNYFQGKSEYTDLDVTHFTETLDKKAKSLIITGLKPWTVYTEPDYKGESKCIVPPKPDFTPAFIYDTENVNISQKSIRSARKECYGHRILVAPIPPNVGAPMNLNTSLNTVDTFAKKNNNSDSTIHGSNYIKESKPNKISLNGSNWKLYMIGIFAAITFFVLLVYFLTALHRSRNLY